MKHPLILSVLFSCSLFGCQPSANKDKKTLDEYFAEQRKNQVDFNIGSQPRNFLVKTIDGQQFELAKQRGKHLVVFVYDKTWLKVDSSYNLSKELNGTYHKFKDQIAFVGIINGDIEPGQLKALLASSKMEFPQIDNTVSGDKSEVINDNVVCTPAKIIIDPAGKVLYNGCGGAVEEIINYKLDSIVHTAKAQVAQKP